MVCVYFQFNATVVREYSVYDFNTLEFLRLALQLNIWSILVNVQFTLENCVLCSCWIQDSINVNLVKFINCVFKYLIPLTVFGQLFKSVTRRRVLQPPSLLTFSYISLYFFPVSFYGISVFLHISPVIYCPFILF